MACCPEKCAPNWLLRGFVALSALVHLIVLLHVSGLFDVSAARRIEVSLLDSQQPPARALPRPKPRPPEPERDLRQVSPLEVPRPVFAQLQRVSAVRPEASVPLTGGVPWGDPGLAALPVGDVGPLGIGPEAAGSPRKYAGEETGIYQQVVKARIERQKRYPDTARRRQAEGRATLCFVISPEGALKDVKVVRSSCHADLDEAAAEAVRRAAPFPPPPAALGKGDIRLELTVAFELMARGY